VGGRRHRIAGLRGGPIPWPLLISVLLLGTGVAALAGVYPARIAAVIPFVLTIAHHERMEGDRWPDVLGGAPGHLVGRLDTGDDLVERSSGSAASTTCERHG
jgi:hypothetical protein